MCLNLLGIAIDIGISYTHFSEDNGMNIIVNYNLYLCTEQLNCFDTPCSHELHDNSYYKL